MRTRMGCPPTPGMVRSVTCAIGGGAMSAERPAATIAARASTGDKVCVGGGFIAATAASTSRVAGSGSGRNGALMAVLKLNHGHRMPFEDTNDHRTVPTSSCQVVTYLPTATPNWQETGVDRTRPVMYARPSFPDKGRTSLDRSPLMVRRHGSSALMSILEESK